MHLSLAYFLFRKHLEYIKFIKITLQKFSQYLILVSELFMIKADTLEMPNSQCLGKFETDIFKPVQYRFLKYHFININNINFVINFANSSETDYTGIKLVQMFLNSVLFSKFSKY